MLKKTASILALRLIFIYSLLITSCTEAPVVQKKEMWAVVIDFQSPDTSNYQARKNFPFPDVLQYSLPDTLFVNQNRLPIISDSSIVYYKRYNVNGENVCCTSDTLQVLSDTILGKKYLFIIGEYIALFQSDSITKLKPRKGPAPVPLWGIKLNTPYPADSFLDKYEMLGARKVKIRDELNEVSRQTWASNDSILVETIQFNNSNDRFITSLYKEMKEQDVNSMIDYLRNNFTSLKYTEGSERNEERKQPKTMRFDIDGIVIVFTQTGNAEYSLQVTDYYETLKLILRNQQGYVFRDDVRVY